MNNYKLLELGRKIFKGYSYKVSHLEAELLLSYVLEVQRDKLIFYLDKKANYKTIKEYLTIVERRAMGGEPIAYIVERQEFYSLNFYVNDNVLIPRPETEHIVEYVLYKHKELYPALKGINYHDMCSGSGCVITSVLKNAKDVFVGECSDISEDALKIASKNMKLHGLSGKISIIDIKKDMGMEKKYDLITINPPYVSEKDLLYIDRSVSYEPKLALDGGDGGYEFYKYISKNVKKSLRRGGILLAEIGMEQKKRVITLFKDNDYIIYEELKDLSGKDRVLVISY